MTSTNVYMKIDGLRGDGSHVPYPEHYSLTSFETELKNETSMGTGTTSMGAGKARFEALIVERVFHAESNSELSRKLVNGTMIPFIDFIVFNGSDKAISKVRIATVFVTNIKTSYEGDQYKEEIEFTFGAIVWFAAAKGDPLAATTLGQGWDVTKNLKVADPRLIAV